MNREQLIEALLEVLKQLSDENIERVRRVAVHLTE